MVLGSAKNDRARSSFDAAHTNECPSNLKNLKSFAIERTCEEVQKRVLSLSKG